MYHSWRCLVIVWKSLSLAAPVESKFPLNQPQPQPPKPKKPNIRQVAEASGVSLMTASRALSGRGGVAEETKQRVLAAAKQLQYRPNRLVRAVMGGRSGTIGVMVPLGSWFLAQVVRGIHDVLAEHRYLPVVHFHGDGPGANRDDAELDYLHRLIEQRVDGIIFVPSDESVSRMYLREVWERGLPLVSVDRRLPRTNADFSGTDDEAGGRVVAEYLLSLGHRRIAHISGEPWVSTYAERRRGFEEVVHGRDGVEYQFADCERGDCRDAVRVILASKDRPTAIFTASDRMAAHVYAVAEELGLQVSRDVSVVGFGDQTDLYWLRPKLTTVNQDPVSIGAEAARLVLDRLEGRCPSAKPRESRVMPQLCIRESAAPVA
jgi:LacI family transcriptional regulator